MNKISLLSLNFCRRFFSVCKPLKCDIPNGFNFDSKEEILENQLEKVMLIGINLPDSKNMLTETAVEKLCETLKSFQNNEQVSVGILHGIGGNFCTGVVSTKKALSKCAEVIEVMNSGKKPLIASLNGYTKNFGFQLALMCDLRVMEELSVAGFGCQDQREHIPLAVYKRLAATFKVSGALELTLIQNSWSEVRCRETGFSDFTVTCGASLGKAICLAQNISLVPQKTTMDEKYRVLSAYKLVENKT